MNTIVVQIPLVDLECLQSHQLGPMHAQNLGNKADDVWQKRQVPAGSSANGWGSQVVGWRGNVADDLAT